MANKRIVPILFGPFLPDRSIWEPQILQRAENMLPAFGSWRPIEAPSTWGVKKTGDGPVLRAYVHPWVKTSPPQRMQPNGDQAKGSWQDDARNPDNDLHVAIGEKEPELDKYVVSPGAPTNQKFRVHLAAPQEAPPDSSHIVYFLYRFYGVSAAYELIVRLIKGASTVIASKTVSATGADTGWLVDSFELSGAERAAIGAGNYGDLDLEFEATKAGSTQQKYPILDQKNGQFTDEGGATTSLFASVNAVDDLTYIVSAVIESGRADLYEGRLDSFSDPAQIGIRNAKLRTRASNTGVKVQVFLFNGAELLQKSTETAVTVHAADFSDLTIALDPLGDDPIDYGEVDWSNLRLQILATYPVADASTQWATSRPAADVSNADFDVTAIAAKLSDQDDGTFVTSDAAGSSVNPKFTVDLGGYDIPTDNPQEATERQIIVRAQNLDGAAAHSFKVRVYQNAKVVATKTHSMSAGAALQNYTWDISGEATITDFTAMRVEVLVVKGGSGWQLKFAEVSLQLAAGRRLFCSEMKLELDSGDFAGVAWGQLQVPQAAANSVVANFDNRTLLVHTPTKLYTVGLDTTGFTDITGGALTAGPRSGDFCSFGDTLVFTDYTNPVKKWDPVAGGNIANLITSGEKPKGAFCATVREQLMLANLTGGTTPGQPDETWQSAIDDAADFDPDVNTGAGRKRLRQIPGEITRLLGGEAAIAFKRQGILRGSWQGKPTLYRWDVLSSSIGTDQPWSVVQDGERYYFKATRQGFFAGSVGQAPVQISSGVDRRFFDYPYSSSAIARVWSNDPRVLDNRIVGARDPDSGLIIWFYRDRGKATDYQLRFAAVYDPSDGRFSFIDLESGFQDSLGKHVCALVADFNVQNDATNHLRGLFGFHWTGANTHLLRFNGDRALTMTFETGIRDLENLADGPITKVFGARPFYRAEARLQDKNFGSSLRSPSRSPVAIGWGVQGSVPLLLSPSSVSLQITTADDPFMEAEAVTQTTTGDRVNEQGWFPFSLSGRFLQATMTVSNLHRKSFKEVIGIQLQVATK